MTRLKQEIFQEEKMEPYYLDVANSGFIFVLCAIPVAIIVCQTILFIRLAWRQGKEIGFSEEKMKQCIKSSGVFSIIPSLTLVTLYVALSVSIGKYFPWLRLSNIGAGAYESIAAGVGLSATGLTEYSQLTLSGLLTIMLCMNFGMSIAPLNTLITLKTYDKSLRKAKNTNPFLTLATSAAFVGIIARLTMPYYMNVSVPLSFIAAIVGAIVMLLCMVAGNKYSFFKEFGLSFGIIAGVGACIIANALHLA